MDKKIILSAIFTIAAVPSVFAQSPNVVAHTNLHATAAVPMNKNFSALTAANANKEKPSFYADGYRYAIVDEAKKEVEVIKLIKGDEEKANTYKGDAVIPEKASNNGVEYTVVGIGNSTFFLKDLVTIQLPKTIRYISDFAFFMNNKLKEIILPDAVETVGTNAFEYCNSLRKLGIGKSLKSIGKEAIYDCWYLEEITVNPENKHFKTIDGILYDYAATTLYKCPAYRKSVTKVTLPSTLKTITLGAMMFCEYFTEIILPEGLENIEGEAFRACINVKEFNIPSTVKSIKNGDAFAACSSLQNFKVAETNSNYCSLNGHLYSKDKKTLISYCTAKVDAKGLAKIEDGTEEIFDGAFAYNNKVKKVIMPNSVKKVNGYIFVENKILTDVTFSDNIENLADVMFTQTKKMTNLYIGSATKDMYPNSFAGCNALKKVTVNCQTPPSVKENEDEFPEDLFDDNVYQGATLYVPKGTKEAYKAARVWKEFADIEELPEGVTSSIDNITTDNAQITVSGNHVIVTSTEATDITVYDANGRNVFNAVQTKQADISLTQGLYIVKVGRTAHKIAI